MDDAPVGAGLEAKAARAIDALALDEIDPSEPGRFRDDAWRPMFARLRREDPVHWAVSPVPEIGGFWSVTRYNDIVAVDTNHEAFSSAPGVGLPDAPDGPAASGFISMDPPRHDAQRKAVSPITASAHLAHLEPIIRARAGEILDALPIGEEFDWVDKVSIELTTMTLAILFDFPWEDRRKLTYWSDVATSSHPSSGFYGTNDAEEHQRRRNADLQACVGAFLELWNQRVNAPPRPDLISMMAHDPATRDMDRMDYLGNLMLLIVGGNDTTRNTISGSVLALHQFPDQDRLLRSRPELLSSFVSEAIRWQTPVAFMRRTAVRDVELGGKTIRRGDKVAMWYLSGNRDETVIQRPEDFWIERPRVRQHVAFGFGIHRCLGNRLAELQLKVIWEEILKRFPSIDVVGPPQRTASAMIHGFQRLPVLIPKGATPR